MILKKPIFFTIEARSLKDKDKDVYYGKTHFRNYIDLKYLKDLLIENNFEILYSYEGNNLAKYKNENQICIRVICKKR